MSKVYWTQRNGKKINIDEMDINHLRNALKMIVRNISKSESEERLFKHQDKDDRKFQLNGDMAEEFNRSYIEDEEDDMYYDDMFGVIHS